MVTGRCWNIYRVRNLHNLYRIRARKESGWFGMKQENCFSGSGGRGKKCINKNQKIDGILAESLKYSELIEKEARFK